MINLGEGELDFDTPLHVKEAGIQAIRDGDTKYTAVSGTDALKNAIVEKFHKENGLSFALEEIIAGAGAKQIIFNAFQATVSQDDEVIIPAPYWVSYPEMVRLADGAPRIISSRECRSGRPGRTCRRDHTAHALAGSKFSDNPTGAIYSRHELASLAEVLLAHEHVLVMSDDIYEHIRYSGDFVTIAAVEARLRNRTLTVNGVSKAYSMTGWRIGYAAGPSWLISAIDTLHSAEHVESSSISQAATVRALRSGREFITDWIAELRVRRDLAVKAINSAKGLRTGTPNGAFYLFVNCMGTIGCRTPDDKIIRDDLDLANYLLDSVGVGIVHGGAFGAPGYVRIAYAVDRDVLADACGRIINACNALR